MSDTARITLIRGGTVWTGGAAPRVQRADVVIADGVIAAIEPNYQGRWDTEIDAGGCLVAPGLVNAHVHPGATARARGVAEDLEINPDAAFYHNLGGLLRFGLEELTRDEFGALLAWDAAEMLLGGATTLIAEMIVAEEHGMHLQWLDVAKQLGFRAQLGLTYPNRVGAIGSMQGGKIVKGDPGDVAGAFAAALRLHETHNGGLDGRLRVHLSPHGPDTVPEEILRATKQECAARGIHAHLHLAQHLSEVRTVQARHGTSPVRYLHDIGFLGPDVMATHVTYVDEADIALLAASGTHVVHCSYRKAKEAITSPFQEFLAAGVNVAIATDSFSHDLILDLKLACLLGKIRGGKVGQPTAQQALVAATHGAARALGRPDLGRLEPGARGDVMVVSLQSPFVAPVFDPVRALVYYGSASDIRHTLVDGEAVVRNGKLAGLDLDALRPQVEAACARLWELAQSRGVLPGGVSFDPICCGAH